LDNLSVDENAEGATIGSLTTTDVDAGDTATYTVSDDRFEVVDGDLKLKDGVSLNHEEADSVSVTVTATDSGGLTTSETFEISVGDVNESAVLSDIELGSISEDGSISFSQADLLAGVVDDNAAALSIGTVSVNAEAGTITNNGDGTWTFNPTENYAADDINISFEVIDGENVQTGAATITVDAEADTPVLTITEAPSIEVTTEIFSTDFESVEGDFVETADGWTTTSESIEMWNESSGYSASGGDQFIELNEVGGGSYDDAANIQQTVDTTEGATYTLTFDYSPRPGYDESVTEIEVVVDGVVVDTIAIDGSELSDTSWSNHTYSFEGTGNPTTIEFRSTGDVQEYGRGGYLDNIGLTETTSTEGTFSGDEDTAIALPEFSGALTDGDGSESLSYVVGDIPEGAILSDGDNSFSANAGNTSVDVSGWDLSSITILPPQDFNGSIDLNITATATESSNGDQASTSQTVTIDVVSVNDAPDELTLDNTSVDENEEGAVVGSLSSTDVDAGDSVTYSVSDDRFEVVDGDLKLKDGVSLDYEAGETVSLTVTATDSGGLTTSEDFDINVGDVAEGPVTLWSEDFSGLSDGARSDTGDTAWSTDDSDAMASADHGVDDEAYAFGKSTDSAWSDQHISWSSEEIDISGQETLTLSFDLGCAGDMEESGQWEDYFSVYVVIDGVRQEVFTQEGDDGNAGTYQLSDFGTGETLVIEFEAKATSNSEVYTLDNIQLVGGSDSDSESAGTSPTWDWSGTMPTTASEEHSTDENIDGSKHNDTLYGNGNNENIEGGKGSDYIDGGAGHDTIDGGDKSDVIYGGAGDDTIYGGKGNGADTIYGGDGNDTIDGEKGNDYIQGDAGDDVIFGGKGSDTIYGGDGNDAMDGGEDADYLSGGDGNDLILGGEDSDQLYGNDGNDVMVGGEDNDYLSGGEGNDLFIYQDGDGSDTVLGGAGWTDTISLQGDDGGTMSGDWTVTITSGSTTDSGDGYMNLSDDADGYVSLEGGETISFQDIERIEW